jgi:hypothetical protein
MDPRILAGLMGSPWVGEPPPLTLDGSPEFMPQFAPVGPQLPGRMTGSYPVPPYQEPNAVPAPELEVPPYRQPNAVPAPQLNVPGFAPMNARDRMAEVEQMRSRTLPNGDVQVMRQQDGGPQKKGIGRQLLEGIPSMLTAGIAAAATPNIAGGGPTDVFRAMQAGNEAVTQRDMAAWHMQQQRQNAEDNRRYRQSQIDYNRARMEAAQRGKPQPASFGEKYEALMKIPGMTPDRAMVIASGGVLQDKSTAKTTPQQRPTIVPPGSTVLGPDGKPTYTAPGKPAAAAKPPAYRYFEAADGSITAVGVGPDGKPFSQAVPGARGMGRKPDKEGGSDKPRMGTPSQFAMVEHRKVTGFQKAKDKLEKAMKGSADNWGKPGQPVGLSEADKAEARRVYDEEMRAIQDGYEQEIIALGGSVSKPAGGSVEAAKSASSYLKKKFGGQ